MSRKILQPALALARPWVEWAAFWRGWEHSPFLGSDRWSAQDGLQRRSSGQRLGVAGGLIGTFTESGVDSDEAHVYAEGVRRGGSVVVARVDEGQSDAAAAILGQSPRLGR